MQRGALAVRVPGLFPGIFQGVMKVNVLPTRGQAPFDSQSLWALWLIKPGERVNVTRDDSQRPVLWGRLWMLFFVFACPKFLSDSFTGAFVVRAGQS